LAQEKKTASVQQFNLRDAVTVDCESLEFFAFFNTQQYTDN